MKLGFIILAHNQPDAVGRLVNILAGAGHKVVIHFDASAPADQRQAVRALEQSYPGLAHFVSKIHCVWGEWSLVEAVLVALREFERMPDKPDYIHLMSGADFPIRPIPDLQEFLRRNPAKDFIECCDITQRKWVKGGLSIERFKFFFPVNFRTSRKTFDRIVRWHHKLKIRRKIPLKMVPHMGSQWWTLRWSTCSKILDFLRENPRVVRYFRSTWIPDESFFQTVLAHLIPREEIADLQLILHHLTPTGRPYVVYPDHVPLVRKSPHFFIRKVAPSAIDDIEELARIRRSPLPRPSHLARVRDIVRGAIDANYSHASIVPGHPYGSAPAGKRKPAVVFITENSAETSLVRAHALAHPDSIWCGRPFASDSIDLTEEILESIGLTRNITTVREKFPEQWIDSLIAILPENQTAVFVLQMVDMASFPSAPNDLMRISGACFASLQPRPLFPSIHPNTIRHVPQRRIRRLLDEVTPHKPKDSNTFSPSIEVQAFGRMGNYFYIDATIDGGDKIAPVCKLVLPDTPEPVIPESVFVQHLSPGQVRLLLFFWVDDGYLLDLSKPHPAHLLADANETSAVTPYSLDTLRDSCADDIIQMLESFGDSSAWSDRMVLELVAGLSVADRYDFVIHAKPHWSADDVDGNLAKLVSDETISLTDNLSSADTWQVVLKTIQHTALEDTMAACVLAQQSILTRDLPHGEILRAIQPCLPRDSRWWPLSLGKSDELGIDQISDALNCAGAAAVDQGQLELAELCFQAAHRIDPSAQSPAWNLGLLLASGGRPLEAQDAFRTICRHYSNQSISTRWPARGQALWPTTSWPTEEFALPEGVSTWPRISIVTPSYNQGHFIEETILSVFNQNYPNLQYIVVDGNSTDDTRVVLERYRSRIDHLIIEPDDGQTQAINKGFRLADGEIIAWLNSDDMYGPGTLHQVALHWIESRADILAGICSEHRNHAFSVINKPSATNRDFNPAQLARIFPYWFAGMYFFQPEVFFTKALLDRVGMLDESLHYAMDYDLWMRFAKEGAQLEVIDWPFAFFRLHDAQKTTQSALCIAEQCAVRNRHHPLELREERKQQLDRQLAVLSAKERPTIAVFGPHFESVITQAAALPQTNPLFIFPASAKDPALSTADAVIVLIGSQRQEIPLIQQLRTADPDRLIVGWFLDHDHNPHANHDAALLVDIIFPTDSSTGDYLRHDSALMGSSLQPDTDLHKIIKIIISLI